HMFSKSSFNALLKTLEEPPPHVKFLLATTDPQKLPVTVLSRCLQFNLKRLPVSLIISHLQHILTTEKVDFNVIALQLIAEAADGSMRDALSLLDQALAFGAGKIEEQDVRDMLGSVSRDKVIGLLQALLQGDAVLTMKAVADLAEFAPDFEMVLAELLSLLHHMSMAKMVPEALDEFVSARDVLLRLSEEVSAEDLQLFYQIALIGRRDLPIAPDAKNGFEMILLRMLAFRPVSGVTNVETGGRKEISKTITPPAKKIPQASPQVSAVSNTEDIESGSAATQAEKVTQNEHSSDWRDVVNALGLGGLVKQLAINCTMQQRDGCHIVLHIESGHSNLINPKARQRLQQALGEYFNIDAQLEIKVVNHSASTRKTETLVQTPAQAVQRETDQRQQQAVQSMSEDSFAQALKENFNAEIVPGSVKPVT
ncbi:MAG: DNA polymerase III subunit gamma/tau, partial [Gammaproteobacteria bacterium]|nr:DNA polymerase III subunit gamma/tau [Gammaproteobacteria bacterium]